MNDKQAQQKPPRVAWFAGTRGEMLHLGPLFKALAAPHAGTGVHWLMNTAEQGMAMQQALDLFALEADESAELCHPGDESAHRLNAMMTRVEAFARGRRADHIVCAGYGPTAAACALAAFARGNRLLWVRPADPAGLRPRLAWEACLGRVIEACAPVITWIDLPGAMRWDVFAGAPAHGAFDAELYGLRPAAPRVLIAVLRREWGLRHGVTDRLARALEIAAPQRADVDWVLLSNLNARLEEPIRALRARPENLRIVPPLAMGAWRGLLAGVGCVITDSPAIAGEAMREGIAVTALADAPAPASEGVRAITPDDLTADNLTEWANLATAQVQLSRAEAHAGSWDEPIAQARAWVKP